MQLHSYGGAHNPSSPSESLLSAVNLFFNAAFSTTRPSKTQSVRRRSKYPEIALNPPLVIRYLVTVVLVLDVWQTGQYADRIPRSHS